jgi:hypothetical protein
LTTTYYASITSDSGAAADVSNSGTSSTATDVYEFRMGNGTFAPNRTECLLALKVFQRWIMQGGTDQAGSNLPLSPNSANP